MYNYVIMFKFISLLGLFMLTRSNPVVKRCDLDILRGTKNIKEVKANFDMKNKFVFYQVQFCKGDWMCLASKLNKRLKKSVENDAVSHFGMWTKLIDTMMGYNSVMPYSPSRHEYEYGGYAEHEACQGKFYIISKESKKVNRRKSTFSKEACLTDNQSCSRTCLRSLEVKTKCHEVRLQCLFNNCQRRSLR